MQKDDIINKIVFEVSKQYSGSENIVKNILIRELYQYDLVPVVFFSNQKWKAGDFVPDSVPAVQ